ncbi:hypothetical protein EDB86DRAFT_3242369 [Lactarius hatsudake]|nr:hypothetical protein EDB86DRAFT_3242369 [Lactarius hatsudake]
MAESWAGGAVNMGVVTALLMVGWGGDDSGTDLLTICEGGSLCLLFAGYTTRWRQGPVVLQERRRGGGVGGYYSQVVVCGETWDVEEGTVWIAGRVVSLGAIYQAGGILPYSYRTATGVRGWRSDYCQCSVYQPLFPHPCPGLAVGDSGPWWWLRFKEPPICGVFDGPVRDRLLYKARRIERLVLGSDDNFILIKFVRQYSIDLHQFCAEAGHAPMILGYERLPGGWYAVAMEYIEFGVSIPNSDLLASHRDRWMTELRQLMNNFHAADLVHGDLRDVNILCKGESVMLVDFDWGGKVGKASFPTLNLHPELLKDRVSESLMITKGDDVRVLTTTLDKLRWRSL